MRAFILIPIALATLALAACNDSKKDASSKPVEPATVPAAATLVPLAEGTPAPDFSATDHTGKTVALQALRGKPVVLYFYPADFGTNCSAEAVAFSSAIDAYQGLGATIIGVSRNDLPSHRDFAEKKNLPFSLLSDPDGTLAAKYGVGIMPNGKLWRVTFLIDGAGLIRKVYAGEGFVKNVEGHSDSVLAALRSM